MLGHALLGGGLAFLIAVLTTPVGVSGAVFLVPVQISLLNTPSPSLTPTNLLYNVIATPGALARYAGRVIREAPLTSALVLGTLPGVVIGAVIRVELLSGPSAFYLVIAAVLVPLGTWLALGRSPAGRRTPPAANDRRITAMALLVGTNRCSGAEDRPASSGLLSAAHSDPCANALASSTATGSASVGALMKRMSSSPSLSRPTSKKEQHSASAATIDWRRTRTSGSARKRKRCTPLTTSWVRKASAPIL